MFRAPKILCISGSSRVGSFNSKLAKVAGAMLEQKGAQVEILDMADVNLPLFSEDIEAKGNPDGLVELKEKFNTSDGILVASPEYNGSMTPLLVNTLSWVSRTAGDKNEAMYFSFKNKTGMIISTSPGGLGGLRGLRHVRELLTNLGTNVVADQVAIGAFFKSFQDDELVDEKQIAMLDNGLQRFFEITRSQANQQATCAMVKLANEYGDILLPK